MEEYLKIELQKTEDKVMKLHIENVASQHFFQWLKAPEYIINGEKIKMFLFDPSQAPTVYNIHHEPTAKYKDVNINKEVSKLFNKRKTEYEQNT
jgi:hypothetical protein